MDKSTLIEKAYGLVRDGLKFEKFGSGHIHSTYLVSAGEKKYILQAFNKHVFRYPERISANHQLLSQHFDAKDLPFVLPFPIKNTQGEFFTQDEEGLYRLFPFVEGVTKDAVEQPQQARLAAEAFAIFNKTFLEVPVNELQESIPDFHNLLLRYQQLQDSFENTQLILEPEVELLLDFYLDQTDLLSQYQHYQQTLPLRVTHSDTKINNLIFSHEMTKVNALIDLDTIMPGYIFYDFGDLARTVACTEDESSQNWGRIKLDMDKYAALLKGFCEPLFPYTSKDELYSLPFGGEMMTYIMGLRFLADYLNGNIYYTIHYPEQNLHRAKNQRELLIALRENRDIIDLKMGEILANLVIKP
ncbi:MAG TPA: aminoglycoside phosphotransferase family protein [Cyclobacteriaceae bacterium]|nr:aminoglycoside phosphotransferase family protein [Cyclobacteriaceae bacterium]